MKSKNYEGKPILLAYDDTFKFGQNFIIAINETAKDELLKAITLIDDDESPEQSL